jgi:hypothetical protein
MNRRRDHSSKIGAAIGFITSEPMPFSHRIGAWLSMNRLCYAKIESTVFSAFALLAEAMAGIRMAASNWRSFRRRGHRSVHAIPLRLILAADREQAVLAQFPDLAAGHK